MADGAAEMEGGGMARTLKDLFSGAAGGIAQVLIGESLYFCLFIQCSCPIIITIYSFGYHVHLGWGSRS
jgi:hypothetical protein